MLKRMRCEECGEEFDLKPDKPGLATVCEQCTGVYNSPEENLINNKYWDQVAAIKRELKAALDGIEDQPNDPDEKSEIRKKVQ